MIDEIKRSKRRTLSITVTTEGKVVVHAPLKYPENKIYEFVESRSAWIEKCLQKYDGYTKTPENLNGYSFLLFGKNTKIVLTDKKFIRFDNENGVIYLPETDAKARLTKWLKDNAKRIIFDVCQKKAKVMGTNYTSLKVNSAKTRWGSCSAKNGLNFSFRLIYADREVLEYVVIHELSHTFYHDHSNRFWNKVEEFCPEWRRKRKWLKDNAFLMNIF